MGIGKKRDMIMAIPDYITEAPGAGEATKMFGAFEERHLVAVASQAEGERHAENAAADDRPAVAVCWARGVLSGVDRAPPRADRRFERGARRPSSRW